MLRSHDGDATYRTTKWALNRRNNSEQPPAAERTDGMRAWRNTDWDADRPTAELLQSDDDAQLTGEQRYCTAPIGPGQVTGSGHTQQIGRKQPSTRPTSSSSNAHQQRVRAAGQPAVIMMMPKYKGKTQHWKRTFLFTRTRSSKDGVWRPNK